MPLRSPTAGAGCSSCAAASRFCATQSASVRAFSARGAVGALRHASKTGCQRHGQDRQRDQDLDQRESLAAD